MIDQISFNLICITDNSTKKMFYFNPTYLIFDCIFLHLTTVLFFFKTLHPKVPFKLYYRFVFPWNVYFKSRFFSLHHKLSFRTAGGFHGEIKPLLVC